MVAKNLMTWPNEPKMWGSMGELLYDSIVLNVSVELFEEKDEN